MVGPIRISRVALVLAVTLAAVGGFLVADAGDVVGATPLPGVRGARPVQLDGLDNVVAFHEGLYSGGVPDGAAGFRTLSRLGVKTIISVDGAVPDVAAAKAMGIRTIHLPIGYDGFDEARRRRLARATHDAIARGGVYVHCHHGRHRSAAVAGTIAVSLGWSSPDAMVMRMRVSGTSSHYPKLYACTSDARRISSDVLDATPADFPEAQRPDDLVQGMVECGEAHDHLLLIERAGWRTPTAHPDVVATAEAARMADILRHLHSHMGIDEWSADFRQRLATCRESAQRLEEMMLEGRGAMAFSTQLARVSASCQACHTRYRD